MMRKILISLIRFYRRCISPTKAPCCRFYPTCSAYAIEALEIHGAIRGTFFAIRRILRCNPFCKGGWDPVPPKINKKKSRVFLPKDRADTNGE